MREMAMTDVSVRMAACGRVLCGVWRVLARREDALGKWDAVPDEVKLEKNKVRAAQNVRQFEARERWRKDKEKRERQYRSDEKAEKLGPHHDNPAMQERPYWEEDWDEEQEREALERLSQTPMWQVLDDQGLERMMKRIRNNPKVLDMLEGVRRARACFAPLLCHPMPHRSAAHTHTHGRPMALDAHGRALMSACAWTRERWHRRQTA
jgi:hypothetical protein